MNKIIIGVVMTLVALCFIQNCSINRLKEDSYRYKQNANILLHSVERYRTSDSLNAARVGVLSLELEEMQQFRAKDLQTIQSLQLKTRDLEQIISIQTQTLANVKGQFKDSIIYRDRYIKDTIRALTVSDEWIDLRGVVYNNGLFDGTLEVRDSLTVVETVRYKRFLGFLWKTKRVKHRAVDVVNKCPYTQITGLESIVIEQ